MTPHSKPFPSESDSLPCGWQRAHLGQIAQVNPRRLVDLNRDDEQKTTFVPMAAVDERHGVIARPETRRYEDVKKGYTFFCEGDVLFAKITPCMQNGKHAIATDLRDGLGFGTTEFHVIRPGSELSSEWVHYYVRRPEVLQAATAHFTGAVGQQRVPKTFLIDLELPVPPLPEQRRIAGILKEQLSAVERARAAAQAQLEAAQALPAAYLREVFTHAESERWPVRRLGDLLLHIEAGKCVNCEERPAKPTEWGVLKVSAVSWGAFNPDENKVLPPDFQVPLDREVLTGDFLISRSNTTELVGAVVHVRETRPRLMLSDKTLRLVTRDDEILKEYMKLALQTPQCRSFIEEKATGASSSMKNITQDTIRTIQIPVPPMAQQRRLMGIVSRQLDGADTALAAIREQIEEIESIPASLLREAFQGRL